MRFALVAFLLVGCTVSAAPSIETSAPTIPATVAPTPVPSALTTPLDPTAAPFNRLDFSIRFVADDGGLSGKISPAWKEATRGASVVRVSSGEGVPVEVRQGRGRSMLLGPPARVLLYTERENGLALDVFTLMHELGHLLGCCRGYDTDGEGHFSGEPRGLMTEPYRCDCPFTDRELRAMGMLR